MTTWLSYNTQHCASLCVAHQSWVAPVKLEESQFQSKQVNFASYINNINVQQDPRHENGLTDNIKKQ